MDSPLSTWTPSFPGLRELPFLTQVDVRGRAVETVLGVALPTAPNTVAVAGDLAVLWLGPDEWLVVGPPSSPVADLMRKGDVGSVVDVSAHRTTIEVTGPRAWELLSFGCALDVLTPGRCAQTLIARTDVLLWAVQDGYRLLVRSSFARYLAAWLDDAALEFTA